MTANTSRIYNWAIQRTESKRAPLWIGLLFFLELVLFIPLDAVLMFFCLQNRRRIWLYVLIATVCSTISGLLGYLIGHLLWDLVGSYIVPHFIAESTFSHFAYHCQEYESWAVFIGALLPLPLKALSLTAGIFHLGLGQFLFFLGIARLVRFSLIGGAMVLWGERVKKILDRHFHRVLLLLGAKVALGMTFFWMIAQ